MSKQGRKAWLVTWEWAGEHARRPRKIAAVMRPQFSGERVRELVEFLYAAEYAPFEQLEVALGLRSNPYPATFGTLQGVTWLGEVNCGDNPYLRARKVDDLIIPVDGEASWQERPRPEIKALNT